MIILSINVMIKVQNRSDNVDVSEKSTTSCNLNLMLYVPLRIIQLPSIILSIIGLTWKQHSKA